MKKYYLLIIFFIMSLSLVFRDVEYIKSDGNYEESVYVFYEVDKSVIDNPDTSDIHGIIFSIFGFNLILSIMLFFDKKKIAKYEDVNI